MRNLHAFKNNDILTIDAPLVTSKPTVILPFGCKQVNGLVRVLPACSCQIDIILEPIESHLITWGSWSQALTGISVLALEE